MTRLTCNQGHTFEAQEPIRLPTLICPRCNDHVATGKETEIRSRREQPSGMAYPGVTAARAIALANSIYKTALKKRDVVTMTTAQRKLAKKGYEGQVVQSLLIKGRSHGGMYQDACTAAVVAIDNGETQPIRISIYVIFRGSAGDGSVGGWVEDRSINLDWRANFDNRMQATDYAPSDIRIHSGFKQVLSSYRGEVRRALNQMRRIANEAGHRHHTVVTGHSQGAAHALLFTHWLAYVETETPVFCIPFSPPRVGDYAFAEDFSMRVTGRGVVLPHDGYKTQNAFLMVKGLDPVSFNQKRASGPGNDELRNRKLDSYGLLTKAKKAGQWEANLSVENQPYFHPKQLTLLPSMVPKIGILKAVDHHPKLFRDKILGQL